MARTKKSPLKILIVLVVCAAVWFARNRESLVSEEGAYQVFGGCTLVDHRSNDGDSFRVRFPDGEVKRVRLYFVDAPESGVRRYRNGETNEKRIDYQGRDLGGLSRDETVALGREAKKWVKERLSSGTFTVSTKWQEVFDSGRYYAFVTLPDGAGERFLHELLVEQGLVRIYTEGAGLPDGTSRMAQEKNLRALERKARSAGVGAWGY